MTKKIQITIELDEYDGNDETIDESVIRQRIVEYISDAIHTAQNTEELDEWVWIDMSDDGDGTLYNEYKIIGIE